MVGGTLTEQPKPGTVFDVLDDELCRHIVSTFNGPMTVKEISEAANVPVSTAYKKIDKLERATLLRAETELRPGGHHRSRYHLDFERLMVLLDEERQFDVEVTRPMADPERQLVDIWSQLRGQT
jgi:predicted transcriptional regulator